MECPGEIGDIVLFRRGKYRHYAIKSGKNKVIHVIGDGGDIDMTEQLGQLRSIPESLPQSVDSVVREDMYEEVKRSYTEAKVVMDNEPRRFTRQQVVARARSRIDKFNDSLVNNNCAHFAVWCCFGEAEPEISQAQTPRVHKSLSERIWTWSMASVALFFAAFVIARLARR